MHLGRETLAATPLVAVPLARASPSLTPSAATDGSAQNNPEHPHNEGAQEETSQTTSSKEGRVIDNEDRSVEATAEQQEPPHHVSVASGAVQRPRALWNQHWGSTASSTSTMQQSTFHNIAG